MLFHHESDQAEHLCHQILKEVVPALVALEVVEEEVHQLGEEEEGMEGEECLHLVVEEEE